ncbi:MAG: MarR family transcriptional regulator [Chitinophagaceae bacterium]|nr:MAG: MarR family transcriptional regulator [Chitinophagaceae bacterium]
MDKNRDEFINETGLFFEYIGVARNAGKVLGYLMSDNRNEVSFQDIQEGLSISKGSASQTLKWLLQNGFVEKVIKSGDRKSYYRFKLQPVENILKERIAVISKLIALFRKGNDIRGNANDKLGKSIEEAAISYQWIVNKMQEWIIELKEQQSKQI